MRSLRHLLPALLLSSILAPAFTATAKEEKPKHVAYTNPARTDDDFIIQGEYIGESQGDKLGVQIIALGNNEFEAVTYLGGLPGAGWEGDKSIITRVKGKRNEGDTTVIFRSEIETAEVDGNMIYLTNPHGMSIGELTRTQRESSTQNAAPPAGALVLFDGKGKNDFTGSRVTEDGLLMEGATSSTKFQDFSIHLEFRLPYMPTARGQARGNSGIYLQGRYEVQMLDSFGLEGKDNECGGLYKIAEPKENMCYPPLSWQTYDIDFTAARFDASGKKTANAKVTVKHNGVLIHENIEFTNTTGSAPNKDEGSTPGPIFLQNHGNPVRYRNVWVKEN